MDAKQLLRNIFHSTFLYLDDPTAKVDPLVLKHAHDSALKTITVLQLYWVKQKGKVFVNDYLCVRDFALDLDTPTYFLETRTQGEFNPLIGLVRSRITLGIDPFLSPGSLTDVKEAILDFEYLKNHRLSESEERFFGEMIEDERFIQSSSF
jgi:hypothetical protein